ncbi:MAG TPA: cytochrome c oxidase subunit I [Longimicrobiales bacterium]|nr:cytochrome c oxidase subunit I [Longimicrobiales bacterium]
MGRFAVFDPPPGMSRAEQERFEQTWSAPKGLIGKLRTINNIPIAQRYMITAFMFFLFGGVMGLLMRIQLGTPENTFLDAETYNQLFTMHGTTMMFLFVIPFIEAIANYVMPLLLGTRDLPFPRLTALSYWTYVLGGIFLYSSFLFGAAPDGGWFAYVPLTNREYSPAINMDWWDIGLSVAEVAAMGAAAELIVAILRTRAPGMSLNRMPVFVWAMLITAFMIIFAFTPLIVGTAMLELDRKGLTSWFVPEAGGEPLLWQHLFWVFGHPEVYIMFIPAVGIVSHLVQVFARRPLVAYPLVILALLATGFISFGLWVHHMFTTGLSPTAMGFFAAASTIIAIPTGIQMFSWIGTLWTGRPVWRTPLLFVIGFLVIFTLGGVTGVMVGSVPFDLQAHDSYFIVAHFHYVLIGGVVFPLVGGLYYWLPKITGRMTSERLGRWNFWMMFVFFNVAFFPMHVSGILGMPRRVYTYAGGTPLDTLNMISTIGAVGFALGVLLFVVNVLWSLKNGEEAGDDPWQADTLEWSQSSPPPQAQFPALPVVRSRHPLWEQDSLEPEDPKLKRQLDDFDWKPIGWRGTLIVTVQDARPLAIAQIPGPSIWPFIMSIAFVFLFAGALLDSAALAGIGGVATLIALFGWFWPDDAGRQALADFPEHDEDPDRLPLAVAGPISSGFWGTLVFLTIMATALLTLVASYYYVGEGPSPWWPAFTPDNAWTAAAVLLLAVLAAGAMFMGVRRIQRDATPALGAPLAVAFAATVATVPLLWRAWSGSGLAAATDAHASAVLFLICFQILLHLVLAAMLGAGLAWALFAAGDRRGRGVAWNAALVAWFVAPAWLISAFTIYLSPELW